MVCCAVEGLYQQFPRAPRSSCRASSAFGDAWKVDVGSQGRRATRAQSHGARDRRGARKLEMSATRTASSTGRRSRKYVNAPCSSSAAAVGGDLLSASVSGVKIETGGVASLLVVPRNQDAARFKALAERFQIRRERQHPQLPDSEPASVVTTPERTEVVSLRVDRKRADRPPEAVLGFEDELHCLHRRRHPREAAQEPRIRWSIRAGEDGKRCCVAAARDAAAGMFDRRSQPIYSRPTTS